MYLIKFDLIIRSRNDKINHNMPKYRPTRQTKLLAITKNGGAQIHTVCAGPGSPLQKVIQDEHLTSVFQNSLKDLFPLHRLYSDSCLTV